MHGDVCASYVEEPAGMIPRTRYAKSGGVSIAYQVAGEGPSDLVLVPGFVSNVEAWWEHPQIARCMRRLASFSRLILLDKRGTASRIPSPRSPRSISA